MARFIQRTVVTTRKEIILPVPATRKDFYQAIYAADNGYTETVGNPDAWDDTLKITANEEEIIISWEVPNGTQS